VDSFTETNYDGLRSMSHVPETGATDWLQKSGYDLWCRFIISTAAIPRERLLWINFGNWKSRLIKQKSNVVAVVVVVGVRCDQFLYSREKMERVWSIRVRERY